MMSPPFFFRQPNETALQEFFEATGGSLFAVALVTKLSRMLGISRSENPETKHQTMILAQSVVLMYNRIKEFWVRS